MKTIKLMPANTATFKMTQAEKDLVANRLDETSKKRNKKVAEKKKTIEDARAVLT